MANDRQAKLIEETMAQIRADFVDWLGDAGPALQKCDENLSTSFTAKITAKVTNTEADGAVFVYTINNTGKIPRKLSLPIGMTSGQLEMF